MSEQLHNAVVITGDEAQVEACWKIAVERNLAVSAPVKGSHNGISTIILAPNGSSAGWHANADHGLVVTTFVVEARKRFPGLCVVGLVYGPERDKPLVY